MISHTARCLAGICMVLVVASLGSCLPNENSPRRLASDISGLRIGGSAGVYWWRSLWSLNGDGHSLAVVELDSLDVPDPTNLNEMGYVPGPPAQMSPDLLRVVDADQIRFHRLGTEGAASTIALILRLPDRVAVEYSIW